MPYTQTDTLANMVTDLRAEVGHSLSSGQGTNMEDTLKYYLRRTQRELYTAHDWPQFIVDETQVIVAGTRYLADYTNISAEQVNELWCKDGSTWYPVLYGIDPIHYSTYDPTNDIRSFPVQRYKYNAVQAKLEVWPLPSADATIMARGQKSLAAFTDDAHNSTLDSQLIVLFAAANVLARQKREDAGLVLAKANQYFTALKAQSGAQKRVPQSMARADGGRRPRPGLDFIPQQ